MVSFTSSATKPAGEPQDPDNYETQLERMTRAYYYMQTNYHKQAAELYKALASEGYIPAQYELGLCCIRGLGVDQDPAKAAYWFRKAAEKGNADAQLELGICYYDGEGVKQDYKNAARWFRLSAEQGVPIAMYNLGVCYEKGRGVPVNTPVAIMWYRKRPKPDTTQHARHYHA